MENVEPNIEQVGGGRKFTKPQTKILPLSPKAVEFLTKKRGILKSTIEAYRLGCNERGDIVLPFFDESEVLQLVKFRDAEGKLLKRKRKNNDGTFDEYEAKSVIEPGGKGVLFGSQLCDPSEGALVICFGDYDAMTVAQEGIPNVTAPPFGDKGFDFINNQWAFLEKFSEIILYPDKDEYPNPDAKIRALKKLDELATRLGKHRVKMVCDADRFNTKDANELLLKKGEGFNRKAIENAEWFPTGIVVVADHIEEEMPEGTPTGLPDIDKATGGFGGGQLIIFSGDNGAGKTTEVLNIAGKFIDEDIPVFVWSGEQKVGKIRYWFERIVAGRNNLRRHIGAKTGFEYFYPCDEFVAPIRNWYRNYLFQYKDVNIDAEQFFKTAELAVRRHGCGLVVIDNLMAFTGGSGDAYYGEQGDFAESAKRFAETWNVAVILICHNKKEDEGKVKTRLPDKNSVEGSKHITNWADYVFQMFRVPESLKYEFENADSLMLLVKARESGIHEAVRLKFDPNSNRFCQKSEEEKIDYQFGWERESALGLFENI